MNGLIEDLYFRLEDKLVEKQTTIAKIQKKVEELGTIAEQLEAYGSDGGDGQNQEILDNDGNPIKMKRKKVTMCQSVQ